MQSATRFSVLFAALCATLSLVNAHGSPSLLGANGQNYTGPLPGSGSSADSPIREISTLAPITDPSDANMGCGQDAATTAALVANVTAGTNVTFSWRSGDISTPWVHRWGPLMLYAYQCPNGTDASACVPPTDAQWFLLSAQGFDPNPQSVPDSSGWMMDHFHNNESVAFPVPANMPNGQYLFRHEMIALHNAVSKGGAEYYVSCTQVGVSSGVDGTPAAAGAELVAIPGVYTETDPGILVDVFSGLTAAQYVMPGPAQFGAATTSPANPSASTTGASGASTAAPVSTADPTSTTSATETTTTSSSATGTTAAPASSSGSCKRKRAVNKRAVRRREVAPLSKKRISDPNY